MTEQKKAGDGQTGSNEYKCDGSCCEHFYLPFTPETIWEKYENYVKTKKENIADISIIGPMVIPIEPEPDSETGWWYTCRHWDKETRLCRIYKRRPKMCKDYPYGDLCNYCNSTCGTIKSESVLPAGGITVDLLRERAKKNG